MKIENKLKKLDKVWEDFVKKVDNIINEGKWKVSFVPYNPKFWLNPTLIRIKKIQREKNIGDKKIIEVFELTYKNFRHVIKSGKRITVDGEEHRKEIKKLKSVYKWLRWCSGYS